MKSVLATAIFASAISTVAANGWGDAKSFPNPSNLNNNCTAEQKSGYDWSGLQTGSFSSFGGSSFSGFQCQNSFTGGRRGRLLRARDGFGGKVIQGTAQKGNGSPSISCQAEDKMSITSFDISTDFDTNMDFIYSMADGSTCKQTAPCKASGSTVQNDQCGGAKSVSFQMPSGGSSGSCSFGIHQISFDCSPPAPPPPPPSTSSSTQTTTTTTPPSTTVPTTQATTTTTSSATTSSVVTTVSTSIVTSSTATSTFWSSSWTSSSAVTSSATSSVPSSSILSTTPASSSSTSVSSSSSSGISTTTSYVCSACSTSVPASSTTTPATTTTPGSSTVTGGTTSTTPALSTSSSVLASTLSTTTSSVCQVCQSPPPNVPNAPCPNVLPSCMNTWLSIAPQCKSNSDHKCLCPNPDFTKKIIDCVSAWAKDDKETQAALSYFAGICADFIPQNPGICTNVPSSITLQPSVPPQTAVVTQSGSTATVTVTQPATTCTFTNTITNSGVTSTVTSVVTVPQVSFVTQTATTATTVSSGSTVTVTQTIASVGLIPAQPAAAPATTTPASSSSAPAAAAAVSAASSTTVTSTTYSTGTTTLALAQPSNGTFTGPAPFTGAASKEQIGFGLVGGVLAIAAFLA